MLFYENKSPIIEVKFHCSRQNEILYITICMVNNYIEVHLPNKFKYWYVFFIGFVFECLFYIIVLIIYYVAIVGGGIGGTSCAYFLRETFKDFAEIDIYEGDTVGGRLATMTMIDGNEYETGGAVLHMRNRYMSDFVDNLGEFFATFFFQY